MSAFDDLIPQVKAGGAFADLIPVIDFDAPDDQVRASIATLPETAKGEAQATWAQHRVKKMGYTPSPDVARGIPIIGPFLDEATAGIQAGLNSLSGGRIGMPYDEALAFERERQKAADAAAPAESAIGRFAGGVATGGPLLSRFAPAATAVGRVGQGMVAGGSIGAVEGFGEGTGSAANRMETAMHGGAVGATIGGALPIVGNLVTRGYGAASDLIGPTVTRWRNGADAAAEDILARRIAAEGSTPAAKRLELQQGQNYAARMASNSRAELPEALADTSDAMQRLTGSVYRAGGEAGNVVRDTLERRQRGPDNMFAAAGATPDGQLPRILDAADRAMLIRSAGSAYQTERQIMQRQAAEGQRLYGQAYQSRENFDLEPAMTALGLVIQQYPRPFAAKLERAQNLFRRSGTQSNQPFWVDDVRRFDGAKKALDDMIEKAQRGGEGNLVRELTQFKNSLFNIVHAVDAAGNPTRNIAYSEARQAWATGAEAREAIALGRAALREGSEVSIDQYGQLSRAQQQLFRVGFSDALRQQLASKRPGNDVTQLFQQQRVRELMREIIPTSGGRNAVFGDRTDRFGDLMRREQRMVQTNNKVLGNSATAQRQQDDMEFAGNTLAGMWNRFRGSPSLFNMGIEAVGTGIQKVFGYRQDVALAMARRLLETDPAERNRLLRRLQSRGGNDRFMRFAQAVDRSSLAITGATAGPLVEQQGGAR